MSALNYLFILSFRRSILSERGAGSKVSAGSLQPGGDTFGMHASGPEGRVPETFFLFSSFKFREVGGGAGRKVLGGSLQSVAALLVCMVGMASALNYFFI